MKRIYILTFLLFMLLSCQGEGEYFCKDCYLPCDGVTYSEQGNCPYCDKELIKESDVDSDKRIAADSTEG